MGVYLEKQSRKEEQSTAVTVLDECGTFNPQRDQLDWSRNLGWDKWEAEFFKWILKKCDVEEMLRRMYLS